MNKELMEITDKQLITLIAEGRELQAVAALHGNSSLANATWDLWRSHNGGTLLDAIERLMLERDAAMKERDDLLYNIEQAKYDERWGEE